MLLIVCVSAFVPFVCVMAVVVGVSWWCVFQCWVAVVLSSRRVPGVVGWLVSCVCLVVACSWCVCVVVFWVGVAGVGVEVFWWFRMLMCVRLSFFLVLSLVCLVVWLITLLGACGLVCARVERWGVWRVGGLVFARAMVCGVRGARLVWGVFLGSCGYWVVVLFFWCALLCVSVFGEGVLGESVCWRV